MASNLPKATTGKEEEEVEVEEEGSSSSAEEGFVSELRQSASPHSSSSCGAPRPQDAGGGFEAWQATPRCR